MTQRDTGTDDPRVRIRPGRGSRPHTKQRPAHADAAIGTVTRIDRGHYRIRLADPAPTRNGTGDITAMKARELRRGKVVVGDQFLLDKSYLPKLKLELKFQNYQYVL